MTLQNPPKPDQPQSNPYTPALPNPQIMEKFGGINTSTTRAGVPDEMCYWIDGFMPVAPRNARTLPGAGAQLRSAFASTIIAFGFFNLGSQPYALHFLADGSVQAVTTTGTITTNQVLAAGSIISPSIATVGFSQWGQNYLLIVASGQPTGNGYWIWDGTHTYSAGALSPIITLTNPGRGYQTIPSVLASGGSGSGAQFAAQIANGFVTSVSVVNPGSGYLAGQTVSLVFTGGTAAGSGGSLTAQMSLAGGGTGGTIALTFVIYGTYYTVTGATITSGGSGYSPFTTAAVNGTSVGAAANLTLQITGGAITAVTLGGPFNGTGYGAYYPLPATDALLTDNGSYYVSGVSIVAHGSGYSQSTSITSTGGGASITAQAAFSPIISGGSISSVVITSPGQYGSNVAPTLTVVDTTATAAATATLMPFGIQGTCIETYQGRAWIANGPIVYFAAPGSFTDFATSDGGGNFTSGDNFLKVGYMRLVNTNGFLYLIADSSMNYISGVTTSGSPPTTTFTNQNADPEVGTPYPYSVKTRGPDIVLANSWGVHVSRGAQLEKVSEALDGVWGSVTNFGSLTQLSSAEATVFSKKIWIVLAQIVDPVSNTTENKLLMWNGKQWYASLQDFGPLTFIATQEINSILTAWGTDGSVIKPLFQTPSTGFAKTIQSRYWDEPGGYQFSKATGRFWSVWNYNVAGSLSIVASIDAVGINGANGETFTNTQPYTIPSPSGAGYFITPPQAVGQQGVLTGMTIQTSEADVSLVSAMIQSDPRISYRG